MIKEILEKLGLEPKEVEIYLTLIKLGSAGAGQLARYLEIPRQTVYSILQKMVQDQFIDQGTKSGIKRFSADPYKLLSLLDKKNKQLEESKKNLAMELPKLLAMQKPAYSYPKIQYYEGADGLVRLFESMLELYARGKAKVFRGYGINNYHEVLGDYLYKFAKDRATYDVDTKLFIADGPDDFRADSGELGRKTKHIKMPEQKAGMYLVADRIYIFSFKDNVGVMIQSSAVAELLQNVFDDHWNKSK